MLLLTFPCGEIALALCEQHTSFNQSPLLMELEIVSGCGLYDNQEGCSVLDGVEFLERCQELQEAAESVLLHPEPVLVAHRD